MRKRNRLLAVLFGIHLTLTACGGGERGGSATDTVNVTDTIPNTFSLADQTDVAQGTLVQSNAFTVTGIDAPAAIGVTGGEYSIDGGSYTSSPGTVSSGQTVRVRHTSSTNPSATVATVVTIGGISDTFSSTTGPASGGGTDIDNIILGRPTASKITASVLAISGTEVFVEYGEQQAQPGAYPEITTIVSSAGGEPAEVTVEGLNANTRYFYRVNHREPGKTQFSSGDEHTFHTQRAIGSTFSFGVQGDSHPERHNNNSGYLKMFNSDLYKLTMNEVAKRQPDFYFMLGDDFSIQRIIQDFKDDNYGSGYSFRKAVEGSIDYATYQGIIAFPFIQSDIGEGTGGARFAGYGTYLEQREEYLNIMAHSTALFLVNGNHEQAHYANLGGIFNNAAIWAGDARNKYYPLPAPDVFYTGDGAALIGLNGYPGLAGDGLRRDYYAFTWGDSLFVTIDPYWHSPISLTPQIWNGDPRKSFWDGTIGDAQYNWLKSTLENSDAKFKFVFAHHVNGAGRGAAELVADQEWGGHSNNSTWGFDTNRPTWAKPIHQLMVDTGVTIFFQGHDHIYSREMVDGLIYQSVPNPADNSYWAYNCSNYDPPSINFPAAGYGNYDPDYGVIFPNSGYLHVTVSPAFVRVDYVRTYRDIDLQNDPNDIFDGTETNGEVAFSYSIPAQPSDNQAADHAFTCEGTSAPPPGYVYQ